MVLPTDPLLNSQWHLGNFVAGLLDLNVRGVWNPIEGPAYTGAGTWTVVIDDGFDFTHPDFTNYNQTLDFDFTDNSFSAFGLSTDSHGTAVAGIIGAVANGSGAVGVAFDTNMVGYRVAGLISDAWLQDIRDAIYNAAVTALGDVANISQGIANDLNSEFGNGYNAVRFDEIETSIGTAVSQGRGGLGMTIVKSAGNSRGGSYDVNADDWTNDTRQVVVAAVDQNGFVSSYSSYGAANLVSGFGTPGEVLTTDRVGAAGYSSTDFTSTFNGTSAAAPMVAGVVSLIYDANADLGWRDVQSILANSARHVGSEVGAGISGSERYPWQWNGADTWNGGGLHFSNDYGYGLVDALAAVRLAETWLLGGGVAQKSANEFTNTMDVLSSTVTVPDGNPTGLSFSGNAGFNDFVDRVTVTMTFSTTYTGDIDLYLTSPDGTVSQLIDNAGGTNNFNGTWTFESQAFRGERAAGTWTVRVVDTLSQDVLQVSDIVIKTFGMDSTNDRYVFTNEYSDYDGLAGHATAIVDTNGGTDVVNAAAVTTASIIKLSGVSTIDGVNVTFTNIENAIGGDAGDTLVGNSVTNRLYGMRGADSLNGGGGIDHTYGGTGNDRYFVDNVSDKVYELSGEGLDRVYSSVSYILSSGQSIETLSTTNDFGTTSINLTGNNLSNTLIGNAGANILNGGSGADNLKGLGGSDNYYVDVGTDKVYEAVGGGTDRVYTSVNYMLAAGQEIEQLYMSQSGGTSPINLTGNEFTNSLVGNAGANVLNGAKGRDYIYGLGGADTFFFNTPLSGGTNRDSLLDYNAAADTIRLENGIFSLLTTVGTLSSALFKDLSLAAQDSNDVIVYDRAGGNIYYDTNGLAAGRTLFADVPDGAALTRFDFVVV